MISIFFSCLFLATILKGHSNGFKPVSFCKMNANRIIGKYDFMTHRYSVLPELKKCEHVDFSFQCTVSICSKKKSDCSEKFKMAYFIGPLRSRYEEMKISKIKNCPLVKKSVAKSDEICLNGEKCQMKISKGFTRARCQCPRRNSFECGAKYCTLDNETCALILNNSTVLPTAIDHCMNGNKIFYKIMPVWYRF